MNVVKPTLEVVDEIVGIGSRVPSLTSNEVVLKVDVETEGYFVMFTVNSYTGDDVIEVAEVATEVSVVWTSDFVVASFVKDGEVSTVVCSVVGAADVVVVAAVVVDDLGGIVESNTHPSGGVMGDHPSVTQRFLCYYIGYY